MTRDDVAAVLIDELGRIAPETDASRLDPTAELRDELDIDSMDFLNLVTALSERLKIDIPETDYPKLATFGHAVDYLVQRLGVAARPVTSSQQPEPNHRGLPSLGRKSS
jgi:acyl carrier protein